MCVCVCLFDCLVNCSIQQKKKTNVKRKKTHTSKLFNWGKFVKSTVPVNWLSFNCNIKYRSYVCVFVFVFAFCFVCNCYIKQKSNINITHNSFIVAGSFVKSTVPYNWLPDNFVLIYFFFVDLSMWMQFSYILHTTNIKYTFNIHSRILTVFSAMPLN